MINNYRRKLELKDDMYIRTSYGRIDKILELDDSYVKGVSQKDEFYAYDIDNIVKASYNIIDMLEIGDYVNGSEVLGFENEYIEEDDKYVPFGVITENCCLDNNKSWIIEKDIKSIVTHEQMEQMAYKVEE